MAPIGDPVELAKLHSRDDVGDFTRNVKDDARRFHISPDHLPGLCIRVSAGRRESWRCIAYLAGENGGPGPVNTGRPPGCGEVKGAAERLRRFSGRGGDGTTAGLAIPCM